MDPRIGEFLTKQRVCSLTTLLKDGSPHAAIVHFSHKTDPLEIYVSTENTSKKCESLINSSMGKASIALGFSEEDWITLQMDGEIQAITDPEELKAAQAIHYPKHPNAEKFKNDPATVFLKFTPKWWRYTDYKTKPPTIMSSDK